LYIINCLSYAVIEIVDNTVKVLSDQVYDIFKQLEDPRIFRFNNDIYLYVQGLKKDSVKFNNGIVNCKTDVCVTPSLYKLTFADSKIVLEEKQINLCNEISRKIEKNWVPYEFNKELFFIYDLNDETVFKYSENKCDIYSHSKRTKTLLKKFSEKINKPSFKFSGGTPLVKIDELPEYGPFLGVGHIKINIGEFKQIIPSFADIESKFLLHHTLVYFMFFYTYDHTTTSVKKISKLFVCHDSTNGIEPYLLQFPCGIEKENENIIVSYGEGDDRCKLVKMKIADIIMYDNIDRIDTQKLFEIISNSLEIPEITQEAEEGLLALPPQQQAEQAAALLAVKAQQQAATLARQQAEALAAQQAQQQEAQRLAEQLQQQQAATLAAALAQQQAQQEAAALATQESDLRNQQILEALKEKDPTLRDPPPQETPEEILSRILKTARAKSEAKRLSAAPPQPAARAPLASGVGFVPIQPQSAADSLAEARAKEQLRNLAAKLPPSQPPLVVPTTAELARQESDLKNQKLLEALKERDPTLRDPPPQESEDDILRRVLARAKLEPRPPRQDPVTEEKRTKYERLNQALEAAQAAREENDRRLGAASAVPPEERDLQRQLTNLRQELGINPPPPPLALGPETDLTPLLQPVQPAQLAQPIAAKQPLQFARAQPAPVLPVVQPVQPPPPKINLEELEKEAAEELRKEEEKRLAARTPKQIQADNEFVAAQARAQQQQANVDEFAQVLRGGPEKTEQQKQFEKNIETLNNENLKNEEQIKTLEQEAREYLARTPKDEKGALSKLTQKKELKKSIERNKGYIKNIEKLQEYVSKNIYKRILYLYEKDEKIDA
jgi:hypothetical protein